MVKRVDVAVYNTVKELIEGRFNGGKHFSVLITTAWVTRSTSTTET